VAPFRLLGACQKHAPFFFPICVYLRQTGFAVSFVLLCVLCGVVLPITRSDSSFSVSPSWVLLFRLRRLRRLRGPRQTRFWFAGVGLRAIPAILSSVPSFFRFVSFCVNLLQTGFAFPITAITSIPGSPANPVLVCWGGITRDYGDPVCSPDHPIQRPRHPRVRPNSSQPRPNPSQGRPDWDVPIRPNPVSIVPTSSSSAMNLRFVLPVPWSPLVNGFASAFSAYSTIKRARLLEREEKACVDTAASLLARDQFAALKKHRTSGPGNPGLTKTSQWLRPKANDSTNACSPNRRFLSTRNFQESEETKAQPSCPVRVCICARPLSPHCPLGPVHWSPIASIASIQSTKSMTRAPEAQHYSYQVS
jgi:hypothetical protein